MVVDSVARVGIAECSKYIKSLNWCPSDVDLRSMGARATIVIIDIYHPRTSLLIDNYGVENLGVEAGENVTFDQVLVVNDGSLKAGAPYVDGASVSATVVAEGKDKKVIVYKYKRKTGYHKKNGHRQAYTELKIDSIVK